MQRLGVSGTGWERQVINLAHMYGWHVAAFRTVLVQRRDGSTYYETPVQADGKGWPDLVLVRDDRVLFRELKSGSGRLTTEQREWRDRLEGAGLDWAVWRQRDLEGVLRELRR